MGLGCSHWSPGFSSQYPNGLGDFIPSYTQAYIYMFHAAHVQEGGNCNVMITGPADHDLQLIFLATAMNSSLYRLNIATTSFPSYQLAYKSVLAFSEVEVLCVVCEPNK